MGNQSKNKNLATKKRTKKKKNFFLIQKGKSNQDSNYLEPTPCFFLLFYLCRFFQIFRESLFFLPFFSPVAFPWNTRACVCVCVCERERVCVCVC